MELPLYLQCKVTALVSSGSPITLVKKSFLPNIRHSAIDGPSLTISDVAGVRTRITQWVELELQFENNNTVKIPAGVKESLLYDLVLGAPFFNHIDGSINYRNHTLNSSTLGQLKFQERSEDLPLIAPTHFIVDEPSSATGNQQINK